MSKTEQLQKILSEKGYTKCMRTEKGKELDDVGVLEEDMNDDTIVTLSKLGWVTWFDAEGSFFSDNEHSMIVTYALSGIGIDANVSDEWIGEEELKLELQVGNKKETLEAFPESQSDYCEQDLIVDSINEGIEMAGLDFDCLLYDTNDQMLCIILAPHDIAEFIKKEEILALMDI